MLRISSTARLITPQEAADLLRVSPHTVSNWIKEGRVPHVELPGSDNRKNYRLPLGALIQSLSGNYDLLPHLEVVDDKTGKVTADDVPFVTED